MASQIVTLIKIIPAGIVQLATSVVAKQSESVYPPLTTHQAWYAALSAPHLSDFTLVNTRLYPFKKVNRYLATNPLKYGWGVKNRDRAVDTCETLREEIDSTDSLAYTAIRLASVLRLCYAAGYIDEAYVWTMLEPVGQKVKKSYTSWRDYGDAYLAQEALEIHGTGQAPHESSYLTYMTKVVADLSNPTNKMSAWQLAPWDVLDQPDRPL